MGIEGTSQTTINKTAEEAVETSGRWEEKIDEAMKTVKSMFNEKMEAVGVIKRLVENPNFENVSQRS